MKELKELIVYLFYGFYQIDYVLGIRELRSYNTRTGGALLLVTLFLYLFSILSSTILVLSWLFDISRATSAILIAVSSFVGIITVLWLSSYILDEKFYKDEFQKLDASSSNFRLILFLVSLMSLITGGFILYLIANISMLFIFIMGLL